MQLAHLQPLRPCMHANSKQGVRVEGGRDPLWGFPGHLMHGRCACAVVAGLRQELFIATCKAPCSRSSQLACMCALPSAAGLQGGCTPLLLACETRSERMDQPYGGAVICALLHAGADRNVRRKVTRSDQAGRGFGPAQRSAFQPRPGGKCLAGTRSVLQQPFSGVGDRGSGLCCPRPFASQRGPGCAGCSRVMHACRTALPR